MVFHIVTLFPESLDSYVNSSIIGRAVRNGKIKIKFYNPREFTPDKPARTEGSSARSGGWKRIDQKPYAGGPGMVIEAMPVIKAVEKAIKNKKQVKIIWLSPSGKQFSNEVAEKFSKKYTDIVIICGRYEGIDARVYKVFKNLKFKIENLSIGPYVLTGGELPAMIILDTISRRLPGVLGKIESVEENRISNSNVYTRPEILEYKGRKYRVPKVLLSGNHAKIEEWKNKKK